MDKIYVDIQTAEIAIKSSKIKMRNFIRVYVYKVHIYQTSVKSFVENESIRIIFPITNLSPYVRHFEGFGPNFQPSRL